jgi:hypothetical protein
MPRRFSLLGLPVLISISLGVTLLICIRRTSLVGLSLGISLLVIRIIPVLGIQVGTFPPPCMPC